MPHTVLVADDSPTIQKRASGILTSEGLEVVTVSNGVAAIKKLPQIKPSVILADVSMPGKDGYEVCDFVKKSPALCHIPVVLVHSDLDPYDEERGARVRADGKIKKRATEVPFDPEELVSTVSKLVAQAEASAAASAPAPPEPAAGAVTEPVDAEPEVVRKQTLDVSALPETFQFAESSLEEVPAAPAEAPPMTETLFEEKASSEPEPLVEAPSFAEAVPAAPEEASVSSEPVLIEEPGAGTREPKAPPATSAERTAIFRVPAEIAEPVLSDELAPAPSLPEPPPPSLRDPEPPPVAATTLEGFSLSDAATGQVRFAPPEADVAPVSEFGAEASEGRADTERTPAPAPQLDPGVIYSIVYKVVEKLSPPMLSAQVIEEMAGKLADEITRELNLAPPEHS